MLQSMTGFGSVQKETPRQTIIVEIKTLNSKFTDIFTRIPKTYSARDIEIRSILQNQLERGKIDFTLSIIPKDEETAATVVNRSLVKSYYHDLNRTAQELGFEPDKTELLRMATMMPNAFNNNIADLELAERDWEEIVEAIDLALKKCIEFRKQEGDSIKIKVKEYAKNINDLLDRVEEDDRNRIPTLREKLTKAVNDFTNSENFDKNRFEQELIYYIEKFDISEEKVRLRSHINYFMKEIEKSSTGKKLNFISQEMGREINTIGSKANDALIQKSVVMMKDELEKIKEQTSNML